MHSLGQTFNEKDYPTLKDFYIARFTAEYDAYSKNGTDPAAGRKQLEAFANLGIATYTITNDPVRVKAIKDALAALAHLGVRDLAFDEMLKLDFTGKESGVSLPVWSDPYTIAYSTPNYPRLQLSGELVDNVERYRLCFWEWLGLKNWTTYEGINYIPTGTQSNTGFWGVKLTTLELGRFLSGYEPAVMASGFRGWNEIQAGRNNMYFKNEVVYVKNGICYDPNPQGAGTYPGPDSTFYKSGQKLYTGFQHISKLNGDVSGGFWAWKWVDGWNMLWINVQEYIDKFLKAPYNVKALVAYGESYENVLKNILMISDNTKKLQKLKGFLSNIDFLKIPESKKDFWDKLVDFVPVIMAGVVTVFTAGLGSPALVAAGGLLASALAAKGKKKQADDLQKMLQSQYDNMDNVDKDKVKEEAQDLENKKASGGGMLLLLLAGVGFLIYKSKSKKRRS